MDETQSAQWMVDLEYFQLAVDALDRQHNSNTIFKESNNVDAPVHQASEDTDSKKRAPQVNKIIATHACVGERTVANVIRVKDKLQDEPELLAEIQDMIRNGELEAKPAGEFVTYPVGGHAL